MQRSFDTETCQSVSLIHNTITNTTTSPNIVCPGTASIIVFYFYNVSFGSLQNSVVSNIAGPYANYTPIGVASMAFVARSSYLNVINTSFTDFHAPTFVCDECTDASGYTSAAIAVADANNVAFSNCNFTNFYGGNGGNITHVATGNSYRSAGGAVYGVYNLGGSSTTTLSNCNFATFYGGNGGFFVGAINTTCAGGNSYFIDSNAQVNAPATSHLDFSNGHQCTDSVLDACSVNHGGCFRLSSCTVNPNDTNSVICGGCPLGFVGNGINCTLDPCSTNNGGCFSLSNCTMNPVNQSVICGPCPSGYDGDGRTCTKKTSSSSCAGNGGCDYHTTCSITNGSVVCGLCPEGLNGTGDKICTKLCGDKTCDSHAGEDCVTCAVDCPSPCALCGDRHCNVTGGETCSNCFEDCGPCPVTKSVPCNPPDCSGHGTCMTNGVCQCRDPYTGSSCSEAPAPVQVVIQNTTTTPVVSITPISQKTVFGVVLTELRERRADGGLEYDIIFSTGSNFTLQENAAQNTLNKHWLAFAQLENQATLEINIFQFGDPAGTPINFANTTTVYGQNEVKIGIKVQNWPFRALSNSLELVFNTLVGDSEASQKSDCTFTEKNANNSVSTLSINVDGITMYGQYEPNAEVDNTIRLITYTLTDSSIVAKAPHFWDTLVIDPSFSILVETADKSGCAAHSKSGLDKKLVVAIAVPVGVFVVALVVALIVIIPRLHLKSQIFSAKRRTKMDGGVEL
eukprot:Phypoly_transcript_00479.p1 GENE.Phypoly_transcript_00479~~Phypoly_transcript_00479.p1  ORF type:complete len:738 (+),score=93.32 Phypoly_transcript_00479:2350-4563(+)